MKVERINGGLLLDFAHDEIQAAIIHIRVEIIQEEAKGIIPVALYKFLLEYEDEARILNALHGTTRRR